MYFFGERVKKYLSQKKDYDIVIDNQSLSSGMLEIQKNYPFVEIIHHPITKDFKYDLIYSNGYIQRFFKKRWYSFLKMNKKVAPKLKKIITVFLKFQRKTLLLILRLIQRESTLFLMD
ncbi:MAG: hypothetical protein Ct9H90mP6_10580 [Gammaproteobacteria bacterium]|nr:MAG: hypothetical protein Ct9H90mP6_10580 [Gammaproteobacteria bacterium]